LTAILFYYDHKWWKNCKNVKFSELAHFWCKKVMPVSVANPIFQKSILNTHLIMAKKASITPLHDRVIVRPAAAESKTAGGIIIPDTAKEKPQRGIVVAAGPGKKDEPVTVKAGDSVLYSKYAGTEIAVDGEDLIIMRESDILAIV
jgi:chaperonin GroES